MKVLSEGVTGMRAVPYKLVCPCSAVCAVSMRVLQCQCGPRGFALVGMHVPVKFLLITISVYKVALQR